MSVPTLTNAIIQPQNIILNQVPLTTVLPAVNAATGVPIAPALAPVTAMDQGGELKTGIVMETIPIAAPAGLVPMQAVPVVTQVQHVKQPVAVAAPQPSTSAATAADHNEVLPKARLQDFVRDIDPNLVLDDEVEELLLNYVDQFIDRIVNGACVLSKHRQENTIDVKDLQQYLVRNYNILTPGAGTEELKPHKRSMLMESHKQRIALIRRALKKY